MAGSLSKKIADFMERYGVLASEVWEVRSGVHAIKHEAIERVALEQGITFDAPIIIESRALDKIAVICVTGHLEQHSEWSFGEAAPANNKNSYPYAMAEKRAKDRVVLKLLQVHGAIYSESEADEFDDPGQGEKGRLLRSSNYAREEYKKLMLGMRNTKTGAELEEWAQAHREELRATPFIEDFRKLYAEHMEELRMANGGSRYHAV